MKIEKEIRGRWWIDGLDKPALPGILETSSGLLKLSVWTPQDATPEQAMHASIEMRSYEVPHVIFGADSGNGPVTLFDCVVIRYATSAGLRSIDLHVGAVLKGFRVSSWQDTFALSVEIKPKFLHRWFNRRLHFSVQTDQNGTVYRHQMPLHLEFPIESGVTIRFWDGFSSSTTLDYEKVTADSQLWFVFDEPQSLASIMEKWEPWVSRLFGLFFGVPTSIEEISVYTTDPFRPEQGRGLFESRGSLIHSTVQSHDNEDAPEPSMVNMVVSYEEVKDRLGEVVATWNKICNQLEPVIALFSAVTRCQSLYLEAQFMFLVQALEIYHGCTEKFESHETPRPELKRMLKAAEATLPPEIWEWAQGKLRYNARPLARKLRDIFEAHKRESEQLFGDLSLAASKITNTRNHLTHHSDEGKGNHLIPVSDLGLVSVALEAILWVVLLREIGVDGEPVRRVVGRSERSRLKAVITNKPNS